MKHKNKVDRIIQQLSLDEKIKLLSGKNFWELHAIESQGLKSIMLTDGPHGLRKQITDSDHLGISQSVPATCFPTASAMACSWNKDLIHQVGQALGDECRSEHVSVLLGPGINIKRHPLCGRNFEYFSEDPYLTGKMAASWIQGVQDKGVGTSLKHYALNNQESHRMTVDVIVDERTMRDLYLKGFEIAVKEAKPWTVMSSYNRINGIYGSEHPFLLQKILKDEWQHEGLVLTDWGANNDRVQGLIAGQELEMPGSHQLHDQRVKKAIKKGLISEELLNKRVSRILDLMIESNRVLEEKAQPYNQEKHHQLAKEVAIESMVLLKNDNHILPLKKDKTVALIGAFAKKPRYQGSGSSLINPSQLSTAYDAFEEILGDHLLYADGYDLKSDDINQDLIDEAIQVAKKAHVVVLMVGLTDLYESEGFDREHMDMPNNHTALIEALSAVTDHLIVCLSNGAPIRMPWLNQAQAVIEQYLSGQASGQALAEIIFGQANPSGKLAETFPNNLDELPSSKNFPGHPKQVIYKEGQFVGYRAYDQLEIDPLFEFGYGCSYTSFEYHNFDITNKQKQKQIDIAFSIKNIGDYPGKEIAQIYVSKHNSKVYRAPKELKSFAKVALEPGESKQVKLKIPYDDLMIFQDGYKLESGSYSVYIGASSKDTRFEDQITISSDDLLQDDGLDAYKKFSQESIITDDTYEKIYQRPLPKIPSKKPYHINSTIKDIKETKIGKKIYEEIYQKMSHLVDSEDHQTTKKMMEKMIEEMPLRSVVIFSEGQFSLKKAEGLIDLMNHKYIRGIFKFITG